MFENDWILASLNNPTLDIDDLVSLGGLNTGNTQFLSKDLYLKSNFIKENPIFLNESGGFSREKFDKFYDAQASRWRDFLNNEFPTGIELDAFDTASNKDRAKVKDINFNLGPSYNPDRVLIGIEGWRTVSERTKSELELAQSLRIFNPETGEFENYTPEDFTLFSNPTKWIENLFKEPLVLAQYEEDTVDELGNKHRKGEYKLNQEGTYYYEKLNGRSPMGKTVLSVADVLTKEDSALNKIDFMDSDDLKKSTAGIVAKNIALIAPMFTPAAPYYYKAIIAKELTKTLPMLHGVITNLFDSKDNETPEWINKLAARGEALSTSNSVWSKDHTFSFENMANLISEIALQWGLLKQIAKAVNWFKDKKALDKAKLQAFQFYKSKVGGNLKGLEAPTDELWEQSTLGLLCLKKFYDPVLETFKKKQRLGADLSLAYMALISNTDVYSDMLERGATKQEAAWVALGSTVGMFSVDRFAHLGEVFYDDLTSESIKLGRKIAKEEFKKVREEIYGSAKKDPIKWYKQGVDLGKRVAENFVDGLKYHDLGGVGKAVGEGLEEVAEELVTDVSKSIYSLLGDIGLYDKSVKDTGAFDNLLERYGMSFIGGTIGGGLFYGIEKYNGFSKARDIDLVDAINLGKGLEIRNAVKEYALKKKAGNSKLSGLKYSRDDAGNITWLSTDNEQESQNWQVANRVLEKINALEANIIGSGTKLSDDLLFDKMVLLEARYQDLKNASHITGYYEEFSKLLAEYLQAKSNYDAAAKTADGTPEGRETDTPKEEEKQKKEENLLTLRAAVDNAQKRINDFLSGDMSLDYTRKLNFALDPVLTSVFLGLDRNKWLKDKVDPEKELTIKEQIELNKEWNEHVKDTMIHGLDKAFLAFKALEKTVAPLMMAQLEFSKLYKNTFNSIKQLYEDKEFFLSEFLKDKPFYNMNSRLTDENGVLESDEEYEARFNLNTPDEQLKYNKRALKIFDLNNKVLADYILQFDDILRPIGYSIDSSTNRTIILNVGYRIKDMIKREMMYPFVTSGSILDIAPYTDIISELNDDLSNIDEIKEKLLNKHYDRIIELANSVVESLNSALPGVSKEISVRQASNSETLKEIVNNILHSNIDNKEQILEDIENARKAYEKAALEKEGVAEARKALYNVIPEGFRRKSYPISTILKNFTNQRPGDFDKPTGEGDMSTVGDMFTINEVIAGLKNPESKIYNFFEEQLAGLAEHLVEALEAIPMSFGKESNIKLLRVDPNNPETRNPEVDTKETVLRLIDTLNRYMDNLVTRVLKNPVVTFYNKLKVDSHSPLENILSSITKEISNNKEELFNINYILNQVYKDYINADTIDAFELNDALAKQLDNAKTSLELLFAYTYAASTSPSGNHYFGLNKQINEFANTHKDVLTREWEPLPEIDSEYALILQGEIDNLGTEIQIWKALSDNNSMNKTKRLINTKNISNELRYKIGKGLSFRFTVGDKEYNLSEGLDALPNEIDKDNLLQQLFQVELLIYNNFNKILKDTGLTAELFFENTEFWKSFFGAKLSDIEKQETSKLHENMKGYTRYDLALYILSLLSDNPSTYYKSVQNSIKDNENIAPLTVQLNLSRLGEAVHTKTYKAGFKALAKLINPHMTVTPNTVYINGVAGAGKTEVVLKNIRLRYIDLDALVIGPTASLAIKLQNSLNEGTSYTLDGDSNIFSKLLPNWNVINDEFQKAISKINDGTSRVETDYFTISKYQTSSALGVKIDLKSDKINFNKDIKAPLIFVDEAAHMNTFLIALLDEYADRVGGTVFLASDSTQSGYLNGLLENLKPADIFCTRSSKLLESLRSSNIQKQSNNNKVSALLDSIDDIITAGDNTAFKEMASKLSNLIKKLNLRVYNKEDDINGDLIGGNIDEVIKVLLNNHKDAHIGFIGNENSPAYLKLKAAGFTNLGEPLTETVVPGKKFMQGLEFAYVIIDNMDLSIDLDNARFNEKYTFLKRFNTLMTRGKIASIFLDKDLSKLVGENTLDEMKSVGFSITNQVKAFRESSIAELDKLDLSLATEDETPKAKEEPKVKEEGKELIISPEPDNSPELNPENNEEQLKLKLEENKKVIQDDFKEDDKKVPEEIDISLFADLLIEANTVVPITGLKETMKNPDGTDRRYPAWLPREKTISGGIRRNIEAIYDGEERITKRSTKLLYQDAISSIQSAVIFGGDIINDNIPSEIKKNWDKRKLQLEVRKATDYDNFGIGTDLKPTFIDINGERYIVSITCRIDDIAKNIDDIQYSAIFDICLLSDPNNLKNNRVLLQIKDNINKKLEKLTGEERKRAESFRDNLGKSIEAWDKFLKRIVEEHPDGYTIELESSDYGSHKTTRLKRRIIPRRLGGTLSIATVENRIVDEDENYIEDYNNFIDTDKRKVVSPVYIVGKKSDELKGKISESVFGKAVVFVSTNTNLKAEELVNRYINLKNNPEAHTPEVRMVLLNNHGLSFTELITHRILTALSGEGEHSKKPWRMDVLGVRMFTAMWNFRAGLENFLKLLDLWKKKYSYNELKVRNITKAESELFNNYKEEWKKDWRGVLSKYKDARNILHNYKVEEVDIENLIEFNLEYCKNIPIFRLGFDFTNANAGGYIRLFNVSNSTVYGKKEANMIAIDEEYATKYHDLLSVILGLLTANNPPELFTKVGLKYKPMATRLVKPDGNDYKSFEYIGKNELQRNLSGLIHTNNKNIFIGETDASGKIVTSANIPAESIFSFFPKAIAAIATKSRVFQTNNDVNGLISISTIDTNDKKDSFDFDVAELFKDGLLEVRGNDNTLFNMFNLIFHGSIESLEKPHAYTEEAPFKYGIFVDPDLELSDDYKEINVSGEDGKNYTFLRCGTNPIYFDVDVDVIPGGMYINLSKIVNKGNEKLNDEHKEELRKEAPIKEEPKKIGYSEKLPPEDTTTAQFKNYLINNGKEDTEESYNEFIEIRKRQVLVTFFNGEIAEANSEIIGYINQKLTDIKVKTVKNIGDKITYIDTDNNTGELRLNRDDYYIEAIPDKVITSETVTNNGLNSMVVDYDGKNIMTHNDFITIMLLHFENDKVVESLGNIKDVEEYFNFLKEESVLNKEITNNDYLTDLVLNAENIEEKDALSDYLLSVNTPCI